MAHYTTGAGTVRAGYVQALLEYLQAQGVTLETVYPATVLTQLAALGSGGRIAITQWQDMFEKAVQFTVDPDLPLKVAETINPRHWGLVGFAAMSCPTMGDVISIVERFERLVDEVNESRLVQNGDMVELQWLPLTEAPSPLFMQIAMASWAMFARRYTGYPELKTEAHFTFSNSGDTRVYERIFGSPPCFSQAVTKLVFPATYLQLPITHSDSDMYHLLLAQADVQMQELRTEPEAVREVRVQVLRRLSSGRVNMEEIAESLGVAPRTLQYRLEECGLSYRELLDQVRRDQAQRLLRMPEAALSEITFLLGYSEQSTFQTAFKRWFGESPGAYRKKQT
ncbi:AraC family transcriptional regulator [Stenotrophobium rhamnosiphilum]|uniref:AraC family transcriptional regulator n=1 Tax=Stenotrophobium rhamnosiphilum TaxID=2029166 RepID=UPI0013750A66|nr:AraC family transcriptional regulator [Stenotrophobium rhamnosiphilum]